ncbi:uncharacterized protein (DUF58 family) [Virgibacillus natechei]|uniref:Uncharacterized protein (DUF58 family) n=1 Tax=Virgibacillus natechei TaxID=1216297 RepID=A0ABS4IF54_9BACI|nr:DUF58 domain-containing protein [Virgibacillus natechei]MBP1969488.1 uncharacterized protein (DUF58 family) [Virgibacillus natechei]UZD11808.1 DUF58 domain-containing protein [Virgibacillus natechei]
MMWKKEYGSAHMKTFDYILVAMILFFIIGILFQNQIVFSGAGILASFLIVYKLYDKSIGRRLELENPRRTIRLFPGEEMELKFELRNRSIFPMINGAFSLQTGPAIKAFDHVEDASKYWRPITIPLSILQRKKTFIELPVIAEERGISRISNIHFLFPHLLNFDSITLKYKPFYHTEFIVFPSLLPVHGAEAVFHMIPGTGRSNFSPFEDIQSQLGTRDYSYTDPFHRINWNASLKSQQLQTNVYEKIVDRSFVFIVNLQSENSVNMATFNENLESLLSYTAYLAKYATEKSVAYEIIINARKPGKVPYVHLREGEGNKHYGLALETLARNHKQSMIIPFNNMLHQVGKQFFKPKTIIVIGEVPPGATKLMNAWKQAQNTVFHIAQTSDGAVIKPIIKDAYTDAK